MIWKGEYDKQENMSAIASKLVLKIEFDAIFYIEYRYIVLRELYYMTLFYLCIVFYDIDNVVKLMLAELFPVPV